MPQVTVETQCVFDRAQQAVVVVGRRIGDPARPVVGDHDRRDVPAARIVRIDDATRLRRTGHAIGFAVLVPRNHDGSVAVQPDRRCRDGGHQARDHRVAAAHEAVVVFRARRGSLRRVDPVHLVALVGNDEGERRNVPAAQIAVERIEAHQLVREIRIGVHRGEVGEAGMLRRVQGRRGDRSFGRDDRQRAGGGEVLQIRSPAQTLGRELRGETWAGDQMSNECGAVGALAERTRRPRRAVPRVVVRYAEGIAAKQRHVIRLARVPLGVHLGRDAVGFS